MALICTVVFFLKEAIGSFICVLSLKPLLKPLLLGWIYYFLVTAEAMIIAISAVQDFYDNGLTIPLCVVIFVVLVLCILFVAHIVAEFYITYRIGAIECSNFFGAVHALYAYTMDIISALSLIAAIDIQGMNPHISIEEAHLFDIFPFLQPNSGAVYLAFIMVIALVCKGSFDLYHYLFQQFEVVPRTIEYFRSHYDNESKK